MISWTISYFKKASAAMPVVVRAHASPFCVQKLLRARGGARLALPSTLISTTTSRRSPSRAHAQSPRGAVVGVPPRVRPPSLSYTERALSVRCRHGAANLAQTRLLRGYSLQLRRRQGERAAHERSPDRTGAARGAGTRRRPPSAAAIALARAAAVARRPDGWRARRRRAARGANPARLGSAGVASAAARAAARARLT
jgi:hypothetical protein